MSGSGSASAGGGAGGDDAYTFAGGDHDDDGGMGGGGGGGGAGYGGATGSGNPVFDSIMASCGSSALVPVGNASVLRYTLRRLESAGMRRVYMAVQGEHQARVVTNWIRESSKYAIIRKSGSAAGSDATADPGAPRMQTLSVQVANGVASIAENAAEAELQTMSGVGNGDSMATGASNASATTTGSAAAMGVEVIAVTENIGTADALREVINVKQLGRRWGSTGSDEILVVHASLIHDVNIQLVAAAHRFNGALATVVVSPKSKDGKGDGNAAGSKVLKRKDLDKITGDMVGLGHDSTQMVYFAPAEDWRKAREVTLRKSLVRLCGRLTLRTDMTDVGLYIFSAEAVDTLDESREIHSIRNDLLPALARKQFHIQMMHNKHDEGTVNRGAASGRASSSMFMTKSASMLFGDRSHGSYANATPSTPKTVTRDAAPEEIEARSAFELDLNNILDRPAKQCFVFNAEASYCCQVNSMDALVEANRDSAGHESFHLTGLNLSRFDNAVDPSVSIGSKSTIGAQCIVGAHTSLGDKCSVKRSVIGANCKLGNGAKITLSLLLDGCVVEHGAQVQGCTLGKGAVIRAKCILKDCQVAPGVTVAESSELRGEVILPKDRRA